MSQELQQYHSIIEQLKPMVREPEFNHVLNQIAGHIPKEKRFLLKMEVKRLARPCIRSMDLRGQVDNECRHFTYAGISHFLDAPAIEVFEQQVRIFGHYSFGVYEAVLSSASRVSRERRSQQIGSEEDAPEDTKKASDKYKAPVVNLLNYPKRSSERMNFAVSLEVFTDLNKSIMATSVDISTSGIKFKTSSDLPFSAGDKVSVYFRGLESEFTLDRRDSVVYTIIGSYRENKDQFISVKRASEYANPPFDQFLEKFIHGNKRRYKVNMNNTIDAIINKSCEQHFSPLFPSLPVFIDVKEGKLLPQFAMSNFANRSILEYWTDEKNELKLGYLLNPLRLNTLCKGERLGEMTVYAFNHIQNDRVYFYSASINELKAHPDLESLFLGFGSRKISWKVFKLQALDARPEDAHAPLSIPDSIGKKIKLENAPPPPRLMARLKNLRYLIHVTDITSELGQECYANIAINRESVKQLKVFGHARNKPPMPIKAFRYKYRENRVETRYQLRSSVTVTYANVTLQGVTEDISTNGLRIELTDVFHGSVDSRVSLNFLKLQAMTNKYDVSALHYRVIDISAGYTVLHLRTIAGEDGKPARTFFDDLIKQNRSRLKTYPDEEEFPGIGHALRCINAKNAAITSFVVHKKNNQYVPYVCVTPEENTRINHIARYQTKPEEANFEFLFRDNASEEPYITTGFRQARAENRTMTAEIFVFLSNSGKQRGEVVNAQWSHRIDNHKARKAFISTALANGQFIALRTVLTNAEKPDTDMLKLEMSYVSMYALHRAKALEENLWSITGCVHLFDITDEVMTRYHFPVTAIVNNRVITPNTKVKPSEIKALLNPSIDTYYASSNKKASRG
jgi:hypothetical protein